MVDAISGRANYIVNQIQPVKPRNSEFAEEIQRQDENKLQDAAIFNPSSSRSNNLSYGPDARMVGAEAPNPNQEARPLAASERAENLYLQSENFIKEFTRTPEAAKGQQIDISI